MTEYFNNIKDVVENIDPENIYNYDETNVTDDPGSTRVERVQEHSKMAISLMMCGNAAGTLLPPFVVYKAQNLYENWVARGPAGVKYAATKSGWFDMETFERWFFEIFIPHTADKPGVKVLVRDNLASHFSVDVVNKAKEANIYFTSLPPNTTHLTQPLDVAFFRPAKIMWKSILDKWRVESRLQGTIPKEIFPSLLLSLLNQLKPNTPKNLASGFRACGLCP
ncbi:jerky protein homolog-like [Anneissia japonica]|uniref:jerky protein homolog-like n=1 Tax=Anneissia japonica TaxID=1529436 RepID=UPI0014259374|nr:jerky protein homolog-like [Anneissia japonica]